MCEICLSTACEWVDGGEIEIMRHFNALFCNNMKGGLDAPHKMAHLLTVFKGEIQRMDHHMIFHA